MNVEQKLRVANTRIAELEANLETAQVKVAAAEMKANTAPEQDVMKAQRDQINALRVKYVVPACCAAFVKATGNEPSESEVEKFKELTIPELESKIEGFLASIPGDDDKSSSSSSSQSYPIGV